MKAVNTPFETASTEADRPIEPQPFWDRLIALLLVVAVIVPLGMLGLTWSRTTLEFENRRAEPWPTGLVWTSQGVRAFTAAFERAFNDRFGGRDQLVRLNNIVHAVVLRKSPSSQVIIGKRNWLFVRGGWYGAFLGYGPYPRNTNEAIAKGIERRARLARELGITYRLLYSPDKHTVYPEYLPDKLRVAARLTRIDEVLQALPADIRAWVIDLREPLLNAKGSGQPYYSSDSHWNSYGAWVGYRELARSLGIAPQPYPTGPEALATRGYAGDLARMMGADAFFQETEILPAAFLSRDANPCQQPTFASPRLSLHKFKCPAAPLGKLVMYRDSFGIALASYVSLLARETILVSNAHSLDVEWLRQVKPDVLVDQIVERGLPNLALQPSAFQKISSLPKLEDIWASFSCSVGPVVSEEGTGHPVRIVRAEGRYSDLVSPTRPDRMWFVLKNEGVSYTAEAEANRPGLVSYFGRVDASMFNLIAGGDELQPGAYEIALVAKFGDGFAKCLSKISLRIPN